MTRRRGTIHVVHPSEAERRRLVAKDDTAEEGEEEEEGEEPIQLILRNVILDVLESDSSYQDLVRCFHFDEFEGLDDFLSERRDFILRRHPKTLHQVHERMRDIAQQIIQERRLQLLGTTREDTTEEEGSSTVALYATPNVRLRPGSYATFLHADGIFPPTTKVSHKNPNASNAMINIWIPLGKEPISNFPLCFYKCHRTETIFAENKLYLCCCADGSKETETRRDDDLRLLYVPSLQWGSFLCFVAGQSISDESVLLHGAVQILEESDQNHGSHSTRQTKASPRQSIELRYLL